MTWFERLDGFVTPKYKRVQRSKSSYDATAKRVYSELDRLVQDYKANAKSDLQVARLIRDDVDNQLRRYHQYCIKEKIGAHYVEVGAEVTDFEHMIPASRIRDLLLLGRITTFEACNPPTCKLSREKHMMLKDNGWASDTPDLIDFWQRYRLCFETANCFTTHDGTLVDTETWTLDKHYAYYADLLTTN